MRSSFPIPVIAALLSLSACGEPEPVEEKIVTQPAVAEAPASMPQQQQMPGMGPITIRMRGTEPEPGTEANYIGDCDDMRPHDDDFEVMSFSAPWKIVGRDQGGAGASYGSPVSRGFTFEKNPDAAEVRLVLHFGLERSDLTAADLTAGLPKVTDLAFSPGVVGLHRVSETKNLQTGYAAVFPLVALEGQPQEPEFTGRYLATVQLIPHSLPIDGWSEGDIIQLFDSFYTERCLGEGLKQALAPFAPTVIYE